MRGKFSDVDPEHWGREYWCNIKKEQMARMNHVNYGREPVDWYVCANQPSVKLLIIVTWDECHALVPGPNDKNEGEHGNKQDDDDEER